MNDIIHQHLRFLQFEIPDYTSPPLPDALAATPAAFRDDAVIDAMRQADLNGTCVTSSSATFCQIPFVPPSDVWTESSLGVILYGGALVDPRGYAVLADRLANEYGLPTTIPVFNSDFPTTVCSTERLEWAQLLANDLYPAVEYWIVAGHSFGGIAAAGTAWLAALSPNVTSASTSEAGNVVVGLVLMAADVQPEQCEGMDFNALPDFPVAAITATEDQVLNYTRWEENTQYLSNSSTSFVSIEGGNHGYFGDYNDTERVAILGPMQIDGIPTIEPEEQWDVIVETIYEVAQRTGLELPQRVDDETPPAMAPATVMPSLITSGATTVKAGRSLKVMVTTTIFLACLVWKGLAH